MGAPTNMTDYVTKTPGPRADRSIPGAARSPNFDCTAVTSPPFFRQSRNPAPCNGEWSPMVSISRDLLALIKNQTRMVLLSRCAFFILLGFSMLLCESRPAYGEHWVQVWFYEDPENGQRSGVFLDVDSFTLNGNGNAVYNLRLEIQGRRIFVLEEASPTRRKRMLSRQEDGKTEYPDERDIWNWKPIASKGAELEYDLVTRFFKSRASSASQGGGRWIKLATDVNSNDYYYDKQSVTWLQDGSCRVWISKVGSDEKPGSDNAESYVYCPDRTFRTAQGRNATPIKPETVQEKIWLTLFPR